MGRDIVLYDDEYIKPDDDSASPLLVQQMVRQCRSLSPSDLRLFFESLFSKMTNTSKEAVTEIMWTGLTTSEQQAFEMPYFGHRWSDSSIQSALRDAFRSQEIVRVQPNRPIRLQDTGTSHFSAGFSARSSPDSDVQALEEQFFAILRSAISRAERTGPAAVRVNVVQTSSAGTNTHNTDNPNRHL